MTKKTVRIIILASIFILAAGISAGTVMKLRASDDPAYRKMVLARNTFEINDVKLYYVEPDEEMQKRYSDSIIYKDDSDLYYFFDTDTQRLRYIDNKALDNKNYSNLTAGSIKPYPDTETLFEDAKTRFEKWYDGDIEKFKWESSTDDLGNTIFEARQLLNDEFSVFIARAKYDMDGDFGSANLRFDAIADLSKRKGVISKNEAIKKAEAFLEKEYGETDWEEITVRDVTGKERLYWEVTFKKTDIITVGYYLGVDLFSGEVWLEGTLR